MTDYTRNYDFSTKDALPTGNPSKLIKGSEVDEEFDALVTSSATKANKAVPSATNNVATLSATGDLQDSGLLVTDVGLPSGTVALFYQSAAPTGWTKVTTASLDNHALRIVTTTVWSSGTNGTNSFTDVLGSGAAVSTDGHTLTEAEMPSHTHSLPNVQKISGGAGSADTGVDAPVATATGSAGGDQAHSHTLSVDINYLNIILATKD